MTRCGVGAMVEKRETKVRWSAERGDSRGGLEETKKIGQKRGMSLPKREISVVRT